MFIFFKTLNINVRFSFLPIISNFWPLIEILEKFEISISSILKSILIIVYKLMNNQQNKIITIQTFANLIILQT